MKGLIFAGIGKGISDASDAYGKMMLAEISDRRQAARDQTLLERQAMRDEALLARQEAAAAAALEKQEALIRLREQAKIDEELRHSEELKKAAPEIANRAGGVALIRDRERMAKDSSKLASLSGQITGSSPSTDATQFRELMEKNPQYRDIYRQAGYIDEAPSDKTLRMERANDEADAAIEVGASKTVIDYYAKKRQATLDQIRLEMADELKRDQLRQKDDQFNRKLPVEQQKADAQTTRAENSGGGKSSGGGSAKVSLERQAETLRKAIKDERNPERKKSLQEDLDDVRKKMRELRNGGGTSSNTSAPAPSPKATVSELPKGARQIGTSNGKPVYETPDGKRFIAK